MIKFEPVYKVRVVYKSGYVHDFEVIQFKMTADECSWEAVSRNNKPVLIGRGEIAAVWQIGVRRRLAWR